MSNPEQRLIDANALIKKAFGYIPTIASYSEYTQPKYKVLSLQDVLDAPTIDAVEVVRCQHCSAYGRSPYGNPNVGWCIILGEHRQPDWFCASGKMKEKK